MSRMSASAIRTPAGNGILGNRSPLSPSIYERFCLCFWTSTIKTPQSVHDETVSLLGFTPIPRVNPSFRQKCASHRSPTVGELIGSVNSTALHAAYRGLLLVAQRNQRSHFRCPPCGYPASEQRNCSQQ